MAVNKCVIFAGRPVSKELCTYWADADYVIAADAGYERALQAGVEPDLALGDYDSSPVPKDAKEVICLPAEKDDTDTCFAVKKALEAGCREIVLLGALGGRLDHTMANLQTLIFLQQQGVSAMAVEQGQEITVLGEGTHYISARPGWYLSLFSCGEQAQGVTLRGVKYPLQNADITYLWPVGVSNEFAAERAEITVSKGKLYCMLCKMEE